MCTEMGGSSPEQFNSRKKANIQITLLGNSPKCFHLNFLSIYLSRVTAIY